MKIVQVDVFKTDIELEVELHSTHTRYQVTKDVYTRITTDEGVVGYGATAPKYYITGETQETAILVLKNVLIPTIIGEDPFNLEIIHQKMDKAIKFNTAAKAAIDLALYDLMGKHLKIPVYKLLGGLYRKKMPAFDLIGMVSPKEAAERAQVQLNAGYQEFKVKVGNDFSADLQRVKAVNEVLMGKSLKIDANQAWNSREAINYINSFAQYGVTVVEQPVHMDDFEGFAVVKAHCPEVEIMADESIKSIYDSIRLAKMQAVDLFNIKLVKTAGLYNAKKIAAIAEASHLSCMAGCTIQNTLVDTASAHFAAATKNVIYNEIKAPLWTKNDYAKGLVIEKGQVIVPAGIGFGLEMDDERLETCIV